MNGHSVSPSDTTGRLSQSLPRKPSQRSPDCDAPTADTDGCIQRGAAFLWGPNKLRGSTDGAADFAAPLPHRQRAAATSSPDAKVRKCTKKVYFHFLSQCFCVQIALTHTVPKSNDLLKTTERSRAEKHLPQWGCWLTDSPQENNGHHHASSGSVKTHGHPRLPQKPTNLGTDAAIEKKLNANQFCILACLGVSRGLFPSSSQPLLLAGAKCRKEDLCIYKKKKRRREEKGGEVSPTEDQNHMCGWRVTHLVTT